MPSLTEPGGLHRETFSRQAVVGFRAWNRRLHYYAGLYLLFFFWLFAFSGLLLNHSTWKFAEFWDSRKQTSFERDIAGANLSAAGDLAQARAIMQQLGIAGEVEWTKTRNDDRHFDFRVSRPGHLFEIEADLTQKRAKVQQSDLNLWGVMRLLHTFTGVRMNDSRNSRDWILTWVWALAMDAVATGLVFLVLSSLVMWFEVGRRRVVSGVVLLMGTLLCGLFCLGLRWLY